MGATGTPGLIPGRLEGPLERLLSDMLIQLGSGGVGERNGATESLDTNVKKSPTERGGERTR